MPEKTEFLLQNALILSYVLVSYSKLFDFKERQLQWGKGK